MEPLSFDHSVSSFDSSANSGTLALLNSRIWLRNRSTTVSIPGLT